MKPLKVYNSVVTMDYSQFYFFSRYLKDGVEATERANLIEKAQNAGDIATDGNEIVIFTPHQHNFEMQLTVELWESKPEDDLQAWQEAFEAGIVILEDTLIYAPVIGEEHEFAIPSGRYAMLITGRDFVDRGWTPSTSPGDKWRVRLWPSQEAPVYRRLKKWDP